jgi:hypothetical protein
MKMKLIQIELCETAKEASIYLLSIRPLSVTRLISLFYGGSSGEIDQDGFILLFETDTHLELTIKGKSHIDFANFCKFIIEVGRAGLIFEDKYQTE